MNQISIDLTLLRGIGKLDDEQPLYVKIVEYVMCIMYKTEHGMY